MAGREFKLTLLLSAIDRATGPVNRVKSAIDRVTAPFAPVSKQLSSLADTAGVDKLKKAWSGVTSAVSDVGDAAEESFGRFLKVAGVAGGAIFLFKREVIDAADEMQRLGLSMVSIEKGNQDLARKDIGFIKQTTLKSPFALGDMLEVFRTMRAQGLDPLNGQMQALVDYVAKIGGSSDVLNRMALELGHASAMGKLQSQQARALAREGIPVWDMLARGIERVTKGRVKLNEAQLIDLAGKGGLGKGAIRILFDQMGIESKGMAEKMSFLTFSGLVNRLQNQWKFIAQRIMKIDDIGQPVAGGPMAVLIEQLHRINDWIERVSSNGRLEHWITRFGDVIIRVFKWIEAEAPVAWALMQRIGAVISWVADVSGGWGNLLKFGLAVYIGGPLAIAIAGLIASIYAFGGAMLLTPIGWFLGIFAAIVVGMAVATFLLIKYWKPITKFFADLWQGIQDTFSGGFEFLTGIFTFNGDMIVAGAKKWASGIWRVVSTEFKPLIALWEKIFGPGSAGDKAHAIAGDNGAAKGSAANPTYDYKGMQTPPDGWLARLLNRPAAQASESGAPAAAAAPSSWLANLMKAMPVSVAGATTANQPSLLNRVGEAERGDSPLSPTKPLFGARLINVIKPTPTTSGPATAPAKAEITVTVKGPRGTDAKVERGSTANVTLERHILMGAGAY